MIDNQEQVQASKFHLPKTGQKLSITEARHKIRILTWTQPV